MFHPCGPTFWELAKQALSSTERGYDLLAPKFDFTPFRTPDEVLSVVGEHLGRGAPIGAALDVCCGTGAAMQMLRPICSERLVGIDMSRGMLDVAKRNLEESSGDAALEFVRGDALDMPFEAEFDLAVCFGAHGHILKRDEPRFVEQICKVLRPGGRFVFVTSTLPPIWSRSYWFSRGFNAAMRVRNLVIRPKFIMYYLTFLLPKAAALFEENGFDVQVEQVFEGRLDRLRLVTATQALDS